MRFVDAFELEVKARYGAAGSSKQRRMTAMRNRSNRMSARAMNPASPLSVGGGSMAPKRGAGWGTDARYYREYLTAAKPGAERSTAMQSARRFLNRAAARKGKPAPYKRGLFSSKLR